MERLTRQRLASPRNLTKSSPYGNLRAGQLRPALSFAKPNSVDGLLSFVWEAGYETFTVARLGSPNLHCLCAGYLDARGRARRRRAVGLAAVCRVQPQRHAHLRD